MGESRRSHRGWRILLPLGAGAAALLAVTKGPIAEVSEIDAFQRAVTTQSKADALAFLRDFGSSHLTADLIELLQPNIALEVCSSLSGEPSHTRAACEDAKKNAVAITPAANTPTRAPSARTHPAGSTPPPGPKIAPTTKVVSGSRRAAIAVVPKDATPPPVPPAKDAAAVSSVEQYSGTATAESLPMPYEVETLRKLTARFDLRPFRVESLDRKRRELVIVYSGSLDRYVMCGKSIGVAKYSDVMGNGANRLNSRMIVRLPDEHSGSNRPYVDAMHIVSLKRSSSGSLDVIDVRVDKPARTSDGLYCWSTGEMERLARLR
jgi:hypothetical protein